MVSRTPVLALLVLAAPAVAGAHVGASPRVGVGLVVEEGGVDDDAVAIGTAASVGVAVGYPWLSLVGDLGFRRASVPSSGLDGDWTEWTTRDTVLTLGFRSELAFLERWRGAAELHVGRSWGDHRVTFGGEALRFRSPREFDLLGGGLEVVYLLGEERLALGARLGADAFLSSYESGGIYQFDTQVDFDRTSFTVGLVAGYRFD